MTPNLATFTVDSSEVGHLYYFAPAHRAPGPYLKQIHVDAIIDVAADGTLAGVELIDGMPPPPANAASSSRILDELGIFREALARLVESPNDIGAKFYAKGVLSRPVAGVA